MNLLCKDLQSWPKFFAPKWSSSFLPETSPLQEFVSEGKFEIIVNFPLQYKHTSHKEHVRTFLLCENMFITRCGILGLKAMITFTLHPSIQVYGVFSINIIGSATSATKHIQRRDLFAGDFHTPEYQSENSQ